MGFFDTDPTDVPSTTSPGAAFQRGLTHVGAACDNIFVSKTFDYKDDDKKVLYFCEGYDSASSSAVVRQTTQARFNLLAASALTAVPLGNLYIEYEVEFHTPALDEKPIPGSAYVTQSTSAVSDSNPFGNTFVVAPGSNLYPVTITGKNVMLPSGTYLIHYSCSGTTCVSAEFKNLSAPGGAAVVLDSWWSTTGPGSAYVVGSAHITSTVPFSFDVEILATVYNTSKFHVVAMVAPPYTMIRKLESKVTVMREEKKEEEKKPTAAFDDRRSERATRDDFEIAELTPKAKPPTLPLTRR